MLCNGPRSIPVSSVSVQELLAHKFGKQVKANVFRFSEGKMVRITSKVIAVTIVGLILQAYCPLGWLWNSLVATVWVLYSLGLKLFNLPRMYEIRMI